MSTTATTDRLLALRAFIDGFAVGADPDHARQRTAVNPLNHDHWRRGFEAGRAAAAEAAATYRATTLRDKLTR
jgi:hypothetical protein